MTAITLSEIQQDLPAYLLRVQAGEILVIMDQDQPIAEIKPIAANSKGIRPFGLGAGKFRVPDNFDEPLPDEILREFGSL